MKRDTKIKIRENLMEFSNGEYEENETPIERLRNELNNILGAIDMYQNDETTIDFLTKAVKHVNVQNIVTHIKDIQQQINP
jgi:hypothetical protein